MEAIHPILWQAGEMQFLGGAELSPPPKEGAWKAGRDDASNFGMAKITGDVSHCRNLPALVLTPAPPLGT